MLPTHPPFYLVCNMWRNLDSGVLYETVKCAGGLIFIYTECWQRISTPTLSDISSIRDEVIKGRWAAKYPISEDVLQRALDGIESYCEGKHVHWITLSTQDEKSVVKMEFNSCKRDGGGIWDIVERLHRKYPEAKYSHFRKIKLNRCALE